MHYYRGIDDLLKNAWLERESTPPPTSSPPPPSLRHQKKGKPPMAAGGSPQHGTSSIAIHEERQSSESHAISSPWASTSEQSPPQLLALAGDNHPPHPLSLEESESKIKEALGVIVSAAEDRSKALRVNACMNDEYKKKDRKFRNLMCSMGGPAAVIGNNIVRASKRHEVDTAIEELQIKQKCDIIYDEMACLRFYDKHKTVLLQMAAHCFLRANTSKCSGLEVDIRKGCDNFNSRVLVKDRKNRCVLLKDPEEIPDTIATTTKRRATRTLFNVKGVPLRVIEKHFSVPDTPISADEVLRPSERANLDITKAEASHVFSTLRRLDVRRPLYFVGGTFYQQKLTKNEKYRWVEVIGWDEGEAERLSDDFTRPTEADLLVLPVDFRMVTSTLLDKYRNHLIRGGCSGPKTRRYYRNSVDKGKLLNPEIDSAMEHKTILDKIDACLDILLSLGKNSVYTKMTVTQYRGKFRRYVIFCFAMYAINEQRHHCAVTPLPFNFFNLFSYMYCHGRQMTASSFLSTLTFIHNHIFRPMSSAAPAVSAKRLLDIDFAIMKGGKAASIRDFGSPAKTSLHTRTLVSFLGFAEMAMGVMTGLLASSRLSETLAVRVAKSLERWCDAIIFIFFTFVLFHRFSAVKKVSLESTLRLILGETHAHTNKVRAAKRLHLRKNNRSEPSEEERMKCFRREVFLDDEMDTSGLTLSHAHLLGLPYVIQAALGVPISRINPLMSPSSGGVNKAGEEGKKYQMGGLLNIAKSLGRAFPTQGEAAGNLGMFENFVRGTIDSYYGPRSFSGIVCLAKQNMKKYYPYDTSSCLISCLERAWQEAPDDRDREEEEGVRDREEAGREEGGVSNDVEGCRYAISRDVEDYLMASPMRMVFVIALDSELNERFLSIGDLALLAVWVKSHVLKLSWDEPVIRRSSYDWLGSVVCKNLLLSDLANFGVWGDIKIVNRLDVFTNTFHRDNERLPSAKDQKKFVRNTTLEDKKSLAMLHSCVNVRTRTHLGRVSSTSWAVDAIRTYTRGNKDVFASLAASLDLYHLGHTNNANFIPYYSNNYCSNEQEVGLWGYVRRTSEKLAKEEMDRGRLCSLGEVGFANTNLAAAALAISASTDLGEAQAVLDDGTRARRAGAASADCNKERERLRTQGFMRLAGGNDSRRGNRSPLRLKDLWNFFADPIKRRKLLEGKPISALCPETSYLNAAVPDLMIYYNFNGTSSCIRLRMKLLPPLQDCGVKRSVPIPGASQIQKRPRLNQDAVVSVDADITSYDKFNLAPTEEARRKMVQQDKECRIATGIQKVCVRTSKGTSKCKTSRNAEMTTTQEVLDDINRLMFLA